eukprot:1884027-Pyramimonas_sp.AAC.1
MRWLDKVLTVSSAVSVSSPCEGSLVRTSPWNAGDSSGSGARLAPASSAVSTVSAASWASASLASRTNGKEKRPSAVPSRLMELTST